MNSLHYNREALLEKVRANRVKHVATYDAAIEIYRLELSKVLSEMLGSAERGEDVEHHIELSRPQTFEGQYARVIQMLDMAVEEEVELDSEGFEQIVMDQWDWSHDFHLSNAAYVGQGR